jgi:hypothetical protein
MPACVVGFRIEQREDREETPHTAYYSVFFVGGCSIISLINPKGQIVTPKAIKSARSTDNGEIISSL